jgi:hypothetical protein
MWQREGGKDMIFVRVGVRSPRTHEDYVEPSLGMDKAHRLETVRCCSRHLYTEALQKGGGNLCEGPAGALGLLLLSPARFAAVSTE